METLWKPGRMPDVTPLHNYASPENLQARISIHGYAVNPGWTSWLFEREFPTDATALRILDLGCGTGALWTANFERVDPNWSLTLADSSGGMLKTARESLGSRAEYVLADAEALPFRDAAFDIVVANHMLYHVPDRSRAFAEFQRVLTPGGALHCSTNGRGHLAELDGLAPHSTNIAHHCEEFGLETGPAQLEPFFKDVQVRSFENSLRVPSAEPILAYLRSSESFEVGTDLSAARLAVEADIKRFGFFHISTFPGLISGARR
jgi:ubiquinone/menaquinone biosynthesis C-methylase UbiE